MLLREIYIPVANLNFAKDFYLRLFSDSIRFEEDGLVALSSGITIVTERKWTELFGIGKEMREKAVLGINVIFETTGFDRFLHHLKLSKDYETIVYKPLENYRGRLQISLLDPDMNILTVRESSLEEAKLQNETLDGSLQEKQDSQTFFLAENGNEDCVNK